MIHQVLFRMLDIFNDAEDASLNLFIKSTLISVVIITNTQKGFGGTKLRMQTVN